MNWLDPAYVLFGLRIPRGQNYEAFWRDVFTA